MTPVHVVAGYLGAGKTTLLQALLPRLPGKSAVIVNDFGQARIDATLLEGSATLTDIPGGCVCCTAPEGLVSAVHALLDEVKPDRIFIEPSGVARPQDLVDMLARGGLQERVARAPTLVLVDVARLRPGEPGGGMQPEVAAQVEAADVLVGSRVDLADADQIACFQGVAAALWPPPARIALAARGVLDPSALTWPRGHDHASQHAHDHDHGHGAEHDHGHATGLIAASGIWPEDALFAWEPLRDLLHARGDALARFKGLFHGDIGWFRVDIAGGRLHVAATGYRRDSRADAILHGDEADRDAFLAALEGCRVTTPTHGPAGAHLTLVGLDDRALMLTREALAALPGQVPDVGALVPGRAGAAVSLAEVLALAAPVPGARFVISAADGMTTSPLAVDGADALLVHALGEGPLPEGQGGPFRLLVPPPAPGKEASRCANVKGVVRIRLLPPAG